MSSLLSTRPAARVPADVSYLAATTAMTDDVLVATLAAAVAAVAFVFGSI